MGFAKSRTQLTNFHFKDLEGGHRKPPEGGRGAERWVREGRGGEGIGGEGGGEGRGGRGGQGKEGRGGRD